MQGVETIEQPEVFYSLQFNMSDFQTGNFQDRVRVGVYVAW
jgi:hypothetical protein